MTHSSCNTIQKPTVSDGLTDHHIVIVVTNMFITSLIYKITIDWYFPLKVVYT